MMKFMAYRERETVTVIAVAEMSFAGKTFLTAPTEKPNRYIGNAGGIVFLKNGNYVTERYHDADEIKNAFDALCGRLGGGIVDGVFYRATNNKNEISLINSGKLKPSANHLNGENEEGLSVWDRPENVGHDYTYKISGEIIGYGSDSEPVLDMSSLKPIGKMTDGLDYVNEYFTARKNGEKIFMEKFGWTQEQVNAIKAGLCGNVALGKGVKYL